MNSVFDGGVELSAKINCDDNLSPTQSHNSFA